MRFPKLGSVRVDSAKKPVTTNEFSCSYFGWVMLPVNNTKSDDIETSQATYERIVEMARRVGIVQTKKKGNTKPKKERATVSVTDEGITISAKDQSVSEPLLHAATDTVICLLLSRRSGIAVVVAHTWDSSGKVGIGCDVVKICNRRNAANFVKAFQNSVTASNIRREAQVAQSAASPIPKPRRRSTLADNTCNGGDGYLAVDSYISGAEFSDGEEDDFCEVNDDMDVHYISVASRDSFGALSLSDCRSHTLGTYLSISTMPTIGEMHSLAEAY